MIFTLAIDGPAAAGKGTIGRAIAARFGFHHLDTGLLYRAVGVLGGDPVRAARTLSIEDVKDADLRSVAAGEAASRVALIPEVRSALLDFQRRFARQEGGAVLDGRDIGTVVCPDAELKLFVTANAETRAQRRWQEVGGDYAAVLEAIMLRDERDASRQSSPMRPAPDAHLLDTSALSIEEAIAHVDALLRARLPQIRND